MNLNTKLHIPVDKLLTESIERALVRHLLTGEWKDLNDRVLTYEGPGVVDYLGRVIKDAVDSIAGVHVDFSGGEDGRMGLGSPLSHHFNISPLTSLTSSSLSPSTPPYINPSHSPSPSTQSSSHLQSPNSPPSHQPQFSLPTQSPTQYPNPHSYSIPTPSSIPTPKPSSPSSASYSPLNESDTYTPLKDKHHCDTISLSSDSVFESNSTSTSNPNTSSTPTINTSASFSAPLRSSLENPGEVFSLGIPSKPPIIDDFQAYNDCTNTPLNKTSPIAAPSKSTSSSNQNLSSLLSSETGCEIGNHPASLIENPSTDIHSSFQKENGTQPYSDKNPILLGNSQNSPLFSSPDNSQNSSTSTSLESKHPSPSLESNDNINTLEKDKNPLSDYLIPLKHLKGVYKPLKESLNLPKEEKEILSETSSSPAVTNSHPSHSVSANSVRKAKRKGKKVSDTPSDSILGAQLDKLNTSGITLPPL